MPQTADEVEEDGSKNMVSNLPLLFADGYPSSLQKITEPQLERFIPFMVQCSLGYVHIHSMTEFNKPEWWPTDLEFTKPFRRPKSFTGVGESLLPPQQLARSLCRQSDQLLLCLFLVFRTGCKRCERSW